MSTFSKIILDCLRQENGIILFFDFTKCRLLFYQNVDILLKIKKRSIYAFINNIFFLVKGDGLVGKVDSPKDGSGRSKGLKGKVEGPNDQSRQTVHLNIHEQALLV